MASRRNFHSMHMVATLRLRWLRYGDGRYRSHTGRMRRKIALKIKYSGKVKRVCPATVQRKARRRGDLAQAAAAAASTAFLAGHSARSKDVRNESRPAVVDNGTDLTASDAGGHCYRDGKAMDSCRLSTSVYSSKRVCLTTIQGEVQTRGVIAQEPATPLVYPSTGSPQAQVGLKGVRPKAVAHGNDLIASVPVGQRDRKDKVVPLGRNKQLQVAAPSLLARRLRSRMDAARFRWLNELLYTSTGSRAADIFKNDPSLFDVYHKGYSEQVSQWPINPLDTVIEYVKGLPKNCVVADLGCGEGRLASSVHQMVHSFDLLSTKSHVTACDMAHLPLASESVDVAVFCLSLMGTNLGDYISEAWRVLRMGGRLKIVEVVSRIVNVGAFVKELEQCGFALVGKRQLSTMFVDLELKKMPIKDTSRVPPHLTLKPCLYKRR